MRLKTLLLVLLALFFLQGLVLAQNKTKYSITVSAGGFDRTETVVSFNFPQAIEAGIYQLEGEKGKRMIPLQVDKQSIGRFIVNDLSAGSSVTYTVDLESFSESDPENPIVSTLFDHNIISILQGEEKIISYYYDDNKLPEGMDEMYRRGGYIHPVYSPSGVPLTNHLDENMHPHHYGIFSAWTHTEFQGRTPDFWNPHNHTARVDHADSLNYSWEGPVHAGFSSVNYFVDNSSSAPVTALNEEWKVFVYKTSPDSEIIMFDIELTQTANTAQPLILPEYRYGGMAFRGHEDWDKPGNVTFLTSEGYNRSNGNGTRARWVHMGGIVNGKRAGIAVLGHPSNYRAPQPVRIHPETPYFVYAPQQLGRMSIEPGTPYTMLYRYITYDGEPDPERLDQLWNDYAYPPGVTVVLK